MVNVQSNRSARKWTFREKVKRFLWGLVHPFWRFSPRLFWKWRVFLLRSFGSKIGNNVHIYPTVKVTIPWNLQIGDNVSIGSSAIIYALGSIKIGDNSTISQNAHLCAGTHDYRSISFDLIKSPITISEGVWICANAFVGPNSTILSHSILGAGSVFIGNMPERSIYVGNPAIFLKKRPTSDL